MTMISYAQNREDVLLNRVFDGRREGFYVDVGACHPVLHSVTKHFYDAGWRGINVEPTPGVFALYAAERPGDLNLNVGISDHEGTLTITEPVVSLGMCTFCPSFAEGLRRDGYECVERPVPVMTLAQLCERHVPGEIDFLKIDVESHELEVLRGADFAHWRPRVVAIEATDRPERWEPILLAADYLPGAFDGLNRYYVRAEDRQLLAKLVAPVNVLDDYRLFEHMAEIAHLTHALHAANARADALEAARRGGRGKALVRRVLASRIMPGRLRRSA